MCESYLMREIMHFCQFYFGGDIENATTRTRRNQTMWKQQFPGQLSIFIQKGQPLRRYRDNRSMTDNEYDQALLCIVMNCPELFNLTRYTFMNKAPICFMFLNSSS